MLNAVLAGKKRGTGLEGQSLALGQAPGAEDVLTATVFERLAYLPDSMFEKVMCALLDRPDFGPLEQLEFWPRWQLASSLVEPDVLLSDGTHHVLVEAKRYDFTQQQYSEQLARELQAGWAEDHLSDGSTLLTLGGVTNYSAASQAQLKQQIDSHLQLVDRGRYRLICRSWQQLHEALVQAVGEHAMPCSGAERLLADITAAFTWHQLRTHSTRWLVELKSTDLQHQHMPAEWAGTSRAHQPKQPRNLTELAPAGLSSQPGHFDHWRHG